MENSAPKTKAHRVSHSFHHHYWFHMMITKIKT